MSLSTGSTLSGAPLSTECQTDEPRAAKQGASLPGVTGQVARGSLWNLSGHVVTLLASLVATPLVIRLLGPEAYGVLALVNLLVGYLACGDLGMGTASTKFGAEAHAHGDDEEEVTVIWTSLLITLASASMVMALLWLIARPLVNTALRLPIGMQDEAVFAIRLATFGFVARSASNVLNTSQLVRMRLDLYSAVNTIGSVMQITFVPVMLLISNRITVAVMVITVTCVATALGHAWVSHRLLPLLGTPRLRLALIKPLARFGIALVVSSLASIVITNLEKALLVRLASVTALAYYSVAFTLANLLVIFPNAIVQSLLPAFSKLHSQADRRALQRLYNVTLRGILLGCVPVAWLLCFTGGPLLRLWAGPEYALNSRYPFYILAMGVILNVPTYVPYTLMIAVGRTDVNARYHLVELAPYGLLVIALTYRFGIIGAAIASSLRMVVAAPIYAWFAYRIVGVRTQPMEQGGMGFLCASTLLIVPSWLIWSRFVHPAASIGLMILLLLGYAGVLWMRVLSSEERDWLKRISRQYLNKFNIIREGIVH